MSTPLSEFIFSITKDTLKFISPEEEERFKKHTTSLKFKTKEVTYLKMTVKRINKNRTSGQAHERSNQNGYYWGTVITTLINSDPFIGHTPDDMDYGLRCLFLRIGGSDAFPKTNSFSKLEAGEFENKMKEIQIWALTDYGIKIETVEEYYGKPK